MPERDVTSPAAAARAALLATRAALCRHGTRVCNCADCGGEEA